MPRPVTLSFDLLTLKSVWESHVTWGTPVQSFVFLGLLVFELERHQTDRRTDDGRRSPLNAPLRGGGIINRRALGGAHVPPTKVFRRLAVYKTILNPSVAAATGAQYLYVGFSRRNKFPRCSAYDIGESNPDRAQKLTS